MLHAPPHAYMWDCFNQTLLPKWPGLDMRLVAMWVRTPILPHPVSVLQHVDGWESPFDVKLPGWDLAEQSRVLAQVSFAHLSAPCRCFCPRSPLRNLSR